MTLKCPVCGEKTISINDKLTKGKKKRIKCSNCKSELVPSNWFIVLIFFQTIIYSLITTNDMHIAEKIIISVLLFILLLCAFIYIVSLEKYEEENS
ncbi:hypothetical protein [Abyssisolibacter fermentans]|uniref:hypothetical protein n=1 Tax=Abyssisolibacter fermentans TaxID=1766203 RepID=UPI000833B929|nr:hypothetical protein [Abyssisolibacter fermentans]